MMHDQNFVLRKLKPVPKDEIVNMLNEVEKIFESENNLIRIESGRVIFVGDTHGDFKATKIITERYLNSENKLVFLGDYVDRGADSEENLNTLLSLKREYPDNLFLLMGNHEGQQAIAFHPADFWERLSSELYERYASALSKLPLAVSTTNGIIATHGALPDIESLDDIDAIEFGDEHWHHITWGDWSDADGDHLGNRYFASRPLFGKTRFNNTMSNLGKNVLIRSHQPNASQMMYDRRCLTIFTSSAYRSAVPERTIAITDLSVGVKTVDDLTLETI